MSWSIDTTHSEITFTVRHMMFAKVRGHFNQWAGSVTTDAAGAITGFGAEIQVASIDTREAQRDGHLKSADFFDAENHPVIRFASTAVKGSTDGAFAVEGDLSIRGVTRPVTLDVSYSGGGKDPWGNTRRGYRATTKVDRRDFGLTWNAALELGGVLVGDEISIEIEVELVQGA